MNVFMSVSVSVDWYDPPVGRGAGVVTPLSEVSIAYITGPDVGSY